MQTSNKTIAKNTLLLYFRLIVTMIVGLYTARIILQTLGVSDYGLYEVVGGFVSLFTVVNSVLASGTSRFLTIALGEGNTDKLKKTFSTALWLHLIFAVLFFLILESFGIWFFFGKMNIPLGREQAALWVFHLSVIATAISVIQVPYNSSLISHEKMNIYAYISLYDAGMKLLIVYLLSLGDYDKLIFYSSLLFVVNVSDVIIYYIYCRRKYVECVLTKTFDKIIVKKMLGFSLWNIFGNTASMGAGQGVNMVINIFCGTSVNAARGIANKVNGLVMQFVSNFLLAVNPQITKSYASGEYERMFNLSKEACKFGTMLILLIGMPLFFEMDFILKAWLGTVPEHTVFFARITILQSLITTMSRPMITILQATGKIKWTSLTVGIMLLMIVPVTYFLLSRGISIDIVYIVNIIPWVLEVFAYIWFIRHYTGVNTYEYLTQVFGIVVIIGFIGSLPGLFLHLYIENGILRVITVISATFLSMLLSILYIGFNKQQRILVREYVSKVVNRFI